MEAHSLEMFAHGALCQPPVDIRIFPKTCEESLRRPFSYGDATAAGEEENGALLFAAGLACGLDGIVQLLAGQMAASRARCCPVRDGLKVGVAFCRASKRLTPVAGPAAASMVVVMVRQSSGCSWPSFFLN